MSELYWYEGDVTRVIDGDTLVVLVDLGFNIFTKATVRLYGIDTPEKFGVKKDSEEYKRGMAASGFTESWVKLNGPRVVLRSYSGKQLEHEKYGRWLADVYPTKAPSTSLNTALVEAGHAIVRLY